MAAKRPSFQFYSADWLKDPAVRSVSLAARGLWFDMLCMMDQSPRRGFLQNPSGKPVTALELARMSGSTTDEVSLLLPELENAGVFSSTDQGVVFSRRMVRDEQKRVLCSEAGRKGGGNPAFKGVSKGGCDPPLKVGNEEEDEGGKSGRKRFTIPSIEDVRAYCMSRANNIDPEHFVDHYSTRGWTLKGGIKMSDWKAAVRTWEKNEFHRSSSGSYEPSDGIQAFRLAGDK